MTQLYREGNPQIYCRTCSHYGDASIFSGDAELDIVQCPLCGGEQVFALTQEVKDKIDREEVGKYDCRYCEAIGFETEGERDSHEQMDCQEYKTYVADSEADMRRQVEIGEVT